MSACTFFGHHDCPPEIKPKLREVLTELIEKRNVDMFYVGNSGAFDRLVRSVLRELTQKYSHISYAVVLSRLPEGRDGEDFSDTILPEGIEEAPPRFAISWRNKWMLSKAELVVTYVTRSWGGAWQFSEKAKSRGKIVIELRNK